MVVTTVTVANARPSIWRFVAAPLSTYERFQVTLSHKYLSVQIFKVQILSPCGGAKINCPNIYLSIFI